MKRPQHLDHLLSQWVFDPNTLNSRMVKGRDGRDIIQMRVDMGVLQMETTGRPMVRSPTVARPIWTICKLCFCKIPNIS